MPKWLRKLFQSVAPDPTQKRQSSSGSPEDTKQALRDLLAQVCIAQAEQQTALDDCKRQLGMWRVKEKHLTAANGGDVELAPVLTRQTALTSLVSTYAGNLAILETQAEAIRFRIANEALPSSALVADMHQQYRQAQTVARESRERLLFMRGDMREAADEQDRFLADSVRAVAPSREDSQRPQERVLTCGAEDSLEEPG